MNEDKLKFESHLETVVSQVISKVPALVTCSDDPFEPPSFTENRNFMIKLVNVSHTF
jgi:hypothetical protein